LFFDHPLLAIISIHPSAAASFSSVFSIVITFSAALFSCGPRRQAGVKELPMLGFLFSSRRFYPVPILLSAVLPPLPKIYKR